MPRIVPIVVGTALAVAAAQPVAGAAFDLDGSWADDPEACGKMFATEGRNASFREKMDVYGSGFIVAGSQIRGRFGSCRITSRKDAGPLIDLNADCATDVMRSNAQFRFRIVDAVTITRLFPGMEGLEGQFKRCP